MSHNIRFLNLLLALLDHTSRVCNFVVLELALVLDMISTSEPDRMIHTSHVTLVNNLEIDFVVGDHVIHFDEQVAAVKVAAALDGLNLLAALG